MKALIVFLSMGAIACSEAGFGFAGEARVELVLPPLPASWADLPEPIFVVTWLDPDGTEREAKIAPGSALRIVVARGVFQAIVAEPLSRGRRLRPAGALYPGPSRPGSESPLAAPIRLCGTETLRLDWIGGYVSRIARDLERAGMEPCAFDLERLGREAARRVLDPWIVPPILVARRLAEGTFRTDSFSEKPRSPIALPLPGPWSPESPFAPAPRPEEGVWTAWLGAGTHRFLNGEGELVVRLEEGEAPIFVPAY